MADWIELIAASEMCGSSQRRNGTRKREVCSADKTSVEPIKIRPSQITTGNQYLKNARIVVVAGVSPAN